MGGSWATLQPTPKRSTQVLADDPYVRKRSKHMLPLLDCLIELKFKTLLTGVKKFGAAK
jgi:hypothetical protein